MASSSKSSAGRADDSKQLPPEHETTKLSQAIFKSHLDHQGLNSFTTLRARSHLQISHATCFGSPSPVVIHPSQAVTAEEIITQVKRFLSHKIILF